MPPAPLWQAELRAASFRGVPFKYKDPGNSFGRRLAKFEFPDSDRVEVQNLGRKIKEYVFQVYVVGDDYMDLRDQVEAAFDGDGPGTLVHPTKGPIQVHCEGGRLRELRDAGRAAFFEVTFVEAGGGAQPAASIDTAAAVQSAAASVQVLLGSAYDPQYDGQIVPVQTAQTDLLGQVSASIAGGLTAALGDDGLSLSAGSTTGLDLADDLATLTAIAPDQAIEYATQLGVLLDDYVTNIVAAIAAPADDASSLAGFGLVGASRLPPLPTDPSYGLAGLAQIQLGSAAAIGVIADDQNTLAQLVQGSATVALVTLYSQTNFNSMAAAAAARGQVTGLIAAQIELAADQTGGSNDPLIMEWEALLAAAVADLDTRAANAPETATFTAAVSMPALALAQMLYQSGSQADALVQRNAAPHPLFMPLAVEYVVAA